MRDKLKAAMLENNIKFDEENFNKYFDIAEEVYKDNIRKTKETYLEHSTCVAIETAKLRLDEVAIYGALLHELPRNGVSDDQLEKMLGKDVSKIVQGVDRLSMLNYSSEGKLNIGILRNMFMAIAKDVRVIIIKLVDRLYNMRNAENMDKEFRETKAKETLKIYAPIAHRLGISGIKSELEDISFRILYPQEYYEMKKKIDAKKSEREAFIALRINEIKEKLKKEGIICEVYGRPKHFYSIYKKMKEKNYEIEDIFDLLAIRIVVNSVKDCYSALGIIHDMYKPMPGRFKDYIAVPKTNNYQSLHTTVFGEGGNAFEVQIRTWDMQKHAEYGIAAHFMYKEKNKAKSVSDDEQKIMWLKQALELQKEIVEGSDNTNLFKVELFGEEVFVFTPKGEIKALPKGSTIVDFAYSVHQNVAEKMTGAKINGKMVPISTVLNNTDVVQIITSVNSKGPSLDWLKFTKSASARSKITAYIKKKDSKVNITRGKEILEKELKKSKIPKDEKFSDDILLETVKYFKFGSVDSLYENIGFGTVSYLKVAKKIEDIYNKKHYANVNISENVQKVSKKRKSSTADIVEVDGISNCLVKFARCCNPILGDDIVGYITYGSGVSIHRAECPNLKSLDLVNRKINVKWKDRVRAEFIASLKIMANYRENVTIDIIKKLQDLKTDMISIKADTNYGKQLSITVCIKTEDNNSLNKVIREIKKIDSIYEVKRAR